MLGRPFSMRITNSPSVQSPHTDDSFPKSLCAMTHHNPALPRRIPRHLINKDALQFVESSELETDSVGGFAPW